MLAGVALGWKAHVYLHVPCFFSSLGLCAVCLFLARLTVLSWRVAVFTSGSLPPFPASRSFLPISSRGHFPSFGRRIRSVRHLYIHWKRQSWSRRRGALASRASVGGRRRRIPAQMLPSPRWDTRASCRAI
jgi:hypothetical protein